MPDSHNGMVGSACWSLLPCLHPALSSPSALTHKETQRLHAVGAPQAGGAVGAGGGKVVGAEVGHGGHVPHCGVDVEDGAGQAAPQNAAIPGARVRNMP